MIEGGIILFLLSALLAFTASAGTAITTRREHRHRTELILPPVGQAYPITPTPRSLGDLVREVDAQLKADELARGVVGVARAYQCAARRRTSC